MANQQMTPEEQMDKQHQQSMEQRQQQLAAQMARERSQETVRNPNFHSEIGDADVDSDQFDWISDEFGPTFSKAHTHGHFHEDYGLERDILQPNVVERLIAESNPGRSLRENPRLLALAQGIRGSEQYPNPTDDPAFRKPMTAAERRVAREAGKVATVQQSLGADGKGIDSQTTVKTENETITSESEEKRGLRQRIGGVFR